MKSIVDFTGGILFYSALALVGNPFVSTAAEITDKKADEILQELKQIRQLLQEQQGLLRQKLGQRRVTQDQIVKLDVVETYVLGKPDAPITLVEFTDYQCPYCSKFHKNTLPQIQKNYINTGKVRFISRDLPLGIHNHALPAARAARCAGEQSKYWELRDLLSSNPKGLAVENIITYAQKEHLDLHAFRACLDSDKYSREIKQDIADANSIGITGTPGFVLGRTSREKFEGVKIKGALSYAAFQTKIDRLLAAPTKKPKVPQ